MEPLKIQDSKKLFLGRVFGSVDASCPEEFNDVMEDVLKKCGGMPLAIVSIASVLAGYKRNKAKWVTVSKSIGSQMESHPTLEGMKHIVTLSYNHLPHELKACMMYFSNFPEDYAIRKERLLSRWIAEGLVHQKRGLTMWEVAESYLDELLSRNMIEDASYEEGYEWMQESYRVHDLLLEVMVSKSLEANFVSLHGGQYGGMLYGKIRHLSIHGNIDGVDSPSKRKPTDQHREDDLDVQHVRSLSMFHIRKHNLLNQLGNFTLLRVLDLEDCEGVTNKHMRYACSLYLLRFLSLRGTNVSKVARQIENLEHLQMLDVSHTTLVGLPETFTKLEKLEQLQFFNKDNDWDAWTVPQGLQKMKALRWLGKVDLGNDPQVAREVGELEQLEYIDLCFDEHKPIDKDVVEELALSLSKMHFLRKLFICHRKSDDGSKMLNFLHRLPTPPRLLQALWISGDIDGLPSWIGSLTNLVTFSTINTTLTDDELFGVLCKLPNLKTLFVTWNCYSGRGELVARSSHKFPVLKNLTLGGYLPKALRFEEGSMAALETIKLYFDPKSADVEERSIIGIEQLTNLKKVTLNDHAGNPAFINAILEQLKEDNDRRSRSNKQFQIVAKYT